MWNVFQRSELNKRVTGIFIYLIDGCLTLNWKIFPLEKSGQQNVDLISALRYKLLYISDRWINTFWIYLFIWFVVYNVLNNVSPTLRGLSLWHGEIGQCPVALTSFCSLLTDCGTNILPDHAHNMPIQDMCPCKEAWWFWKQLKVNSLIWGTSPNDSQGKCKKKLITTLFSFTDNNWFNQSTYFLFSDRYQKQQHEW